MFESLFDLPLLLVGPAIIILLCLYSVIGMLLVRRVLIPKLRIHTEDSEFSGSMVQSVMVFYGLTSSLTAIPHKKWRGRVLTR